MPNKHNIIDEDDIVDEYDRPVDLKLGEGVLSTGHETFHHTLYKTKPIVVKMNKRIVDGEKSSILEVAFSAITKLLMKPGLTPRQNIMMKHDEVRGVTSQNMSNQIQALLTQGKRVYKLKNNAAHNLPLFKSEAGDEIVRPWESIIGADESEYGFMFLNESPQIFFDELVALHTAKKVLVDMDSLACIFTASYALEEDDFHKGNFGFYVTEEEMGLQKITFFKIDHDLMFNDSIMSRRNMRLANIAYTEDSFKITARDIRNFPDLTDSGNHYWPTKWRLMTSGLKAFTREAEIKAFADLKEDPDFCQAKWYYFLKYILVPRELIHAAVTYHLDAETDAIEIAMIQTALDERLAKLRQTLLSMKEFREYLQLSGAAAVLDINKEIKQAKTDFDSQINHEPIIDQAFQELTVAASQRRPLSRAILLGDYPFSNRYGTVALDLGLRLAHQQFNKAKDNNEPAKAFQYACIIIDIVACRNKQVDLIKVPSDVRRFKKQYLSPVRITTFNQFNEAVIKIKQARLPLKQQKNEVIALLKTSHLSKGALAQVQHEISSNITNSPLKFVRQLRSSLWFVRAIRGAYGATTTSDQMMDIISNKVKQRRQKMAGSPHLFWGEKKKKSNKSPLRNQDDDPKLKI